MQETFNILQENDQITNILLESDKRDFGLHLPATAFFLSWSNYFWSKVYVCEGPEP